VIVIVDYGMGNIASIANMCRRIGARAIASGDESTIRAAAKLILPGVGAFDSGITSLESRGLREILELKALEERVPVLGICLGMHLMTQCSEEGRERGLGWVPARTVRFPEYFGDDKLRVPHIGWNTVRVMRTSALLDEGADEQRFYFVHSYHAVCEDSTGEIARSTHGYEFTSAFAFDNIFGVQFHPEKSHAFGMRLMKRFAEL